MLCIVLLRTGCVTHADDNCPSGLVCFDTRQLATIGVAYTAFRSAALLACEPHQEVDRDLLPLHEFTLYPNDTFQVRLTNCALGTKWVCAVQDSSILCVAGCSSRQSDGENVYDFSFRATAPAKGCIGFAEELVALDAPASDSRGVIVSYTCGPLDSVWVAVADTAWMRDTASGDSRTYLAISGTTNAYKLVAETYGTGLLGIHTTIPHNAGSFCDTIPIATRFDTSAPVVQDTRIGAYGMSGCVDFIIYRDPLDGTQ